MDTLKQRTIFKYNEMPGLNWTILYTQTIRQFQSTWNNITHSNDQLESILNNNNNNRNRVSNMPHHNAFVYSFVFSFGKQYIFCVCIIHTLNILWVFRVFMVLRTHYIETDCDRRTGSVRWTRAQNVNHHHHTWWNAEDLHLLTIDYLKKYEYEIRKTVRLFKLRHELKWAD